VLWVSALLAFLSGSVLPVVAAQSVSGGMPKMTTLVSDLTFVVFDTETTGFSFEKDRIVEIGAVKIRNGQIIEERDWLIHPQRSIPKRVTNVHGITDAMVKDKPHFADVYAEFQTFVGDAILIAHNARFDIGMVRAEVERSGLTQPSNVVIDSLKLFRTWYPEATSHKLGQLAAYVGITGEGFHRGDADSRFAAMILFDGLTRHPKCDNLRKLLAASGGVMVF
jgi:DNA polymerase III epsilon subunit family exonuclease